MRDSAVSRRLQQASEQLQAAIVSARRRRQSLSEFDQQKSGVDSDGKWNVEPTAVLTTQDFESDETMSADEAQPMQLEDQQSSEQDEASIATSLASISSSHSPVDRDEEKTADAVQDKREKNNNGIAESDTRKALDWMQRDVEQRARENRRVRETLAIAIHNITDVIADCVDSEASQLLLHAAAVATGMESGVDNNAGVSGLLPDRVDDLVNQWEDALVSWREQCIVEKQELIESFALFEEECLARMQVGEASHRREQERLQYQTSMNQSE
ncbi:hypothetical protein PHYBOEH_005339 [Phytophthora boehmeriae]|uniref:Uncharacterized protein n=1 Tax=Phytophthora boehmeriae TaxID=109152 RepID=A0A8T1X9V9_9STRA|nr:hypothetical protein PHYBOEH_005339 [Phytophthora boehmeriae]